jgi:tRNA threonylcarbamoyladenosine biosynthesis protein TsaE
VSAAWTSESEHETRALGRALAERLLPDGVLLLRGDLGTGKTVLTQGLATGLGIDARQVQSPSFTLVREHDGTRARLIHIDLYRLAQEDVEALGLWELLVGPGVKVVEWSERLPFTIEGALEVEIRRVAKGQRRELELMEPAESSSESRGSMPRSSGKEDALDAESGREVADEH